MNMKEIEHKIYTGYSGIRKPAESYRKLIEQAVLAVLRSEDVDIPCVVSVLITNDEGIRKYNRDYRKIDTPTDVLSFPMQEFKKAGWNNRSNTGLDRNTGELPLGDIILSSETVKRQATEYETGYKRETAYMMIHSTLHLLGYDHIAGSDEKVMPDKQKLIMKDMGYDD